MPTYEYKCFDCSEYLIISDSYDRIKQKEPFQCPQCGADMQKQFSTSFILKGSGWSRDGYVTKGSLKDLDEDS